MATKDVYTIKLVRLDRYREALFTSVSPEAKKVIADAKPESVLALKIATNSPSIRVIDAQIFDEKVFEQILGS
ncbi:MAG: hypothetical protein KGH71_03625 [Candidatus Micrarchaeota archaeon]|nr:hypothetical protein [Candidatus Micrarchaeota archaeon]